MATKPKESKPYSHKGKDGVGVLGTRLKQERLRRGFKVEEFCQRTGVHHCMLTAYENRGVFPSVKSLIAIAQVLDCSIDYLVGLES